MLWRVRVLLSHQSSWRPQPPLCGPGRSCQRGCLLSPGPARPPLVPQPPLLAPGPRQVRERRTRSGPRPARATRSRGALTRGNVVTREPAGHRPTWRRVTPTGALLGQRGPPDARGCQGWGVSRHRRQHQHTHPKTGGAPWAPRAVPRHSPAAGTGRGGLGVQQTLPRPGCPLQTRSLPPPGAGLRFPPNPSSGSLTRPHGPGPARPGTASCLLSARGFHGGRGRHAGVMGSWRRLASPPALLTTWSLNRS